jgi:hypothetical protein
MQMDEARRLEARDRLFNPKTPDPFVSADTGKLMRDIPPRRTLRERLRALAWWRPRRDGDATA